MLLRLLLGLLLFPMLLQAQGTFVLSENAIKAYQACSRFQINQANQFIQIEKKINSANGFSYLIANYCDFLKVFIEDDPIEYRKALARRSQRIKNLEIYDKSSPYYRYCLAEIYLQWSFLRFKQGELLKAANELQKANSLLLENSKIHTDFILNKKGLSIVHILAGSIPENLQWIANIAGIHGNANQGEREINEVIAFCRKNPNIRFLMPEMLFFKQILKINIMDQSLLQPISSGIDSVYKNEPIIQYIDILLAQKTQNASEVIKRIEKFPSQENGISFCYLHYLKAEALMNLNKQSENGFQRFLNCSKGKHFKHAAIRRIAWQYLLQGNTVEYQNNMRRIIALGDAKSEEDKQAVLEASSKQIPDTNVLRARLLFDGGDFKQVVTRLLELPIQGRNLTFVSERAYRLGRSYQMLNKNDEAIAWFSIAINSGDNLPEYFAASAAYNSGKIFLTQGKLQDAKTMFVCVSKFPNHPYKNSLDAKAKTAIKKLN
jgi:tetratricopeptide (TPR) repeat protein